MSVGVVVAEIWKTRNKANWSSQDIEDNRKNLILPTWARWLVWFNVLELLTDKWSIHVVIAARSTTWDYIVELWNLTSCHFEESKMILPVLAVCSIFLIGREKFTTRLSHSWNQTRSYNGWALDCVANPSALHTIRACCRQPCFGQTGWTLLHREHI